MAVHDQFESRLGERDTELDGTDCDLRLKHYALSMWLSRTSATCCCAGHCAACFYHDFPLISCLSQHLSLRASAVSASILARASSQT